MKRTSCVFWNGKTHSSTPNQCALGMYCIDGCDKYKRGRSYTRGKIPLCPYAKKRNISGSIMTYCVQKDRVIDQCPKECSKRYL